MAKLPLHVCRRGTLLQEQGGEPARVLYCGVKFHIRQKNHAGGDLMTLSAEYDLFYSVPASVTVAAEAAEMFAGLNAAYNAWPFFRELVHSTASRMGLPQMFLPLFRPPVRAEESEDEKRADK